MCDSAGDDVASRVEGSLSRTVVGAADEMAKGRGEEEAGASEESTPTKELVEQNSEEDEEEAPTPTLDAGGRVTRSFCLDLIEFYKQQRRLPAATAFRLMS